MPMNSIVLEIYKEIYSDKYVPMVRFSFHHKTNRMFVYLVDYLSSNKFKFVEIGKLGEFHNVDMVDEIRCLWIDGNDMRYFIHKQLPRLLRYYNEYKEINNRMKKYTYLDLFNQTEELLNSKPHMVTSHYSDHQYHFRYNDCDYVYAAYQLNIHSGIIVLEALSKRRQDEKYKIDAKISFHYATDSIYTYIAAYDPYSETDGDSKFIPLPGVYSFNDIIDAYDLPIHVRDTGPRYIYRYNDALKSRSHAIEIFKRFLDKLYIQELDAKSKGAKSNMDNSNNTEEYKIIGMTNDDMLIAKDKEGRYYGLTEIMPTSNTILQDSSSPEEIEINFNCNIDFDDILSKHKK
jgi:hypothetical protein